MAGLNKWIDDLPDVTLPMTGNENIMVSQAGFAKKMKPGDFAAIGSGYIKIDGTIAFTGNQSMGGNILTNLAEPLRDNDAVRLVDLLRVGGWDMVTVLPSVLKPKKIYPVKSAGEVRLHMTDENGVLFGVVDSGKKVRTLNGQNGDLSLGLSLSADGVLSVSFGSGTANLDARYQLKSDSGANLFNIDGGRADSIYTVSQIIEGGDSIN